MEDRDENSPKSGVKEIAKRANVSIATVDRVIHNRKGVSESTREKINKIIEEIGFQPNVLASRLASKKVNYFAVFIPQSFETEYWEAPMKGIERAYQEIKQYGIVLERYFYDLNDIHSFVSIQNAILEKHYDGILLAPSFIKESVSFTSICKTRNIPYVFINSDIPGQDSLSYIGPNLFDSGYQAGQLINFGLKEGKILIINISREIDGYHHLLRKEEGFRSYFKDNEIKGTVLFKIDIHNTDEQSIKAALDGIINDEDDFDGYFVTNSRVQSVANYLKKRKMQDKILIGYDYLNGNIEHLKQGTIDFLIGQKPEEQGYLGLMTLFQYIVNKNFDVVKGNYTSIDIITKENYQYYKN